MNNSRSFAAALVLFLFAGAAQAVKIGADGSGQVLLFPFLVADSSNETSITIRNQDLEFAKALRLVVKDPINGRPTFAINIYLKPGDRWTGTFADPNDSGPFTAVGHLLPLTDESCTFPRASDFPAAGLPFNDSRLNEDFGSRIAINRLSTGSVEVYEMGRISATLAADCDKIDRRWTAGFGAWNQDGPQDIRNQGVAAPTGGISGEAVWVDTGRGISYRYEATVLDEFRDTALHTHPDFARVPSLIDLSPAISKVRVSSIAANGSEVITEQVSNWSTPIHAIDVLLMSEGLGAEYESRSDLFLPIALVALPTFAYHNNLDGFYLEDTTDRVAAPFSESMVLGAEGEIMGEPVIAEARNAASETNMLEPARDANSCDRYRTAINPVVLTNIINFSHVCDLGQAELRIWAHSSRADLSLQFNGELVSDEGVTFTGLPVQGVLFQSVRGQFVDDGKRLSWGWAKPMRRN